MKLQNKIRSVSLTLTFAITSFACASIDPPPDILPDAGTTPPIIAPDPNQSEPPQSPPPDPIAAPKNVPTFASSGNATIDSWRADFATRSVSAGISADIVRAVLEDITPSSTYFNENSTAKSLSAIENQAEFSKAVWQYVETATQPARISKGRLKAKELSDTLAKIEKDYGVHPSAVLGIWGMETSYGGFLGTDNAANMLANMAAEGRRRAFGEAELRAIMKLLASGNYARADLKSSRAGAVGHTQFMPSNVIAFGQDYDNDGKIDLWSSPNDALASAANYLKNHGYLRGAPWGIEVELAKDFDYRLADGRKKTLAQWRTHKLTPLRGVTDTTLRADLWVPTGASGPKFLLFPNFYAFKAYNRSDSYALSVGLLGDLVSGQSGIRATWPKRLGRLNKGEIKDVQRILTRLGYSPKGIDGIFGRNTANAVRRYQIVKGVVADGYPTRSILEQLRQE